MTPQPTITPSVDALRAQTIGGLARHASIEINVADTKYLDASRDFLPNGSKVYVSHLPKQNWADTVAACSAARRAGLSPVPHIPARLLPNIETLHEVVQRLKREAAVEEVLLIAGDYAVAIGPFTDVTQVLRAYRFKENGIKKISIAGHPEGHPKVPLDVIRHAEREKTAAALQLGLEVTLLTQFFFEAEPFLQWVDQLDDFHSTVRIVAGVTGPANVASLFKFSLRCGVGPSMRALVAHPSSMMKLAREHGPERLICDLADALGQNTHRFSGVHFFCFGGFLRTCKWLHAVASGNFHFDEHNGFWAAS
ncbi:MAG TPA: methylenetetrahydrofolate reductase [Steroidobacteraceae bacterium]|nr:methylenetetrahydrofolate reductase [Steroidobacteraceae bacterium]